ncbi:MAG: hypothetical protein RR630_06095 [Coprobacillus sp.]
MRKWLLIVLSMLLLGCSPTVEKNEDLSWEGQYQKDDLNLTIEYDDEYKTGFAFSIMLGEKGIKDFADFEEDKNIAIYDVGEDGHTLEFTLKKDKVIIKESGGINYLQVELSGEYQKK